MDCHQIINCNSSQPHNAKLGKIMFRYSNIEQHFYDNGVNVVDNYKPVRL